MTDCLQQFQGGTILHIKATETGLELTVLCRSHHERDLSIYQVDGCQGESGSICYRIDGQYVPEEEL